MHSHDIRFPDHEWDYRCFAAFPPRPFEEGGVGGGQASRLFRRSGGDRRRCGSAR